MFAPSLAHYNYASKLPDTIKKFIPKDCLVNNGEDYFNCSIGKNAVIHGHGTLPTMAQKYKRPMWLVPDVANLGDDKATIKGNSDSYRATQAGYANLASDIMDRLELL